MIDDSSGDLWLAALVVVFCLLLSAFFSAGETAFTGASRSRMLVLEKGGDKRAKQVNRLLEMRERFIGTVLIGNNIVNIGVSAFATSVLVAIFGRRGRDLRHGDHVGPGDRLRRGAAEDRRHFLP